MTAASSADSSDSARATATADFDAVIVGAGPAGASAAALLARAGWAVAVVEKQTFPRRKVCGECIAASNLALLDALGVGAEFDRAAGPELRRVALMRGDRTVVADLPPASGTRRWGRALDRETLDTLLLGQARAAGAHILQPWAAESIDGTVGRWRIGVRAVGDPARAALTLRAPVAIAAHGSWEALPDDRVARRLARGSGDLLAFKANFRGAALAEGLLPVLSFDGGYGGMVLAGGGLATVACCVRRDRLTACRRDRPGASAGEVVEALLKHECGGVRAALHAAARDGPWLAAGPLDPGIRLCPGDGLLRIGNAAGEAHPILGEGISMALQSAWLLCAHLLDPALRTHRLHGATWQHEAARRYAAEWRHRFGPRLGLAAVFAQAAMRPAPGAALMALAQRWPGLLTFGARWGGKVRCAVDAVTLARFAATASSGVNLPTALPPERVLPETTPP